MVERAKVLIELDFPPTGRPIRVAHVYISGPSPAARRVVKRWVLDLFVTRGGRIQKGRS